MNIDQESNA